MEVTLKEEKPSIEDLLIGRWTTLRRGFELRRDFKKYELNDKEISREEYEDIEKELLDYLYEKCESVRIVDIGPSEVYSRTVWLYKCPIGKVGITIDTGDEYTVFRVYVGDDAWKKAKRDGIETAEYVNKWFEEFKWEQAHRGNQGIEEIEEDLKFVLEEMKSLPE
jgi:hypothetical protein